MGEGGSPINTRMVRNSKLIHPDKQLIKYQAFLEMSELVKCFSVIIQKLVAKLKVAIILSFHKYTARVLGSKPVIFVIVLN